MDDFNLNLNKQENRFKKFISVPNIIFGILGLILVVELISAFRTLTLPTPPPPKAIVQAKGFGNISLTTEKTRYSINELIPVQVIIDTGGKEISGADLILYYDPEILDKTPNVIVSGQIFDEYPIQSFENKGIISISGVSGPKAFNGTGLFAVINLTPKQLGKASITVDFKKGSTIDSNLVESKSSQDILEVVNNLELDIR